MSDDDHDTREQRRREIVAEARATIERLKDFEQCRDEPLPLLRPRDRVGDWRQRATEREMECAAAKAELQLEQRLEQERAVIFEAIGDALAQAMAQQRDFVLATVEQAIAKLRAERDDSRSAEVAAEIARLWASLTAAHQQIVAIQKDREGHDRQD